MNIDPRTLKELLRLQMLSKLNSITGGTSVGSEDDSDFSDLLNSIMSQSTAPDSGADAGPLPGGVKASFKPLNVHPGLTFNSLPGGSASRAQMLNGAAKPSELDPLIMDASRRHGVQPSLVKAVIDAESSFNPHAVSTAGAKGLMQLMDETGRSVGVTNPYDPSQNIQGGTRYLSNLLNKYDGNQGAALAAYNAGSGRLDRLGISNDRELAAKLHLLPQETQNYVSKVMKLQREYEV